MSWLSTLFHGDKGVNQAGNSLLSTGAKATGEGFGDVGSASTFWQNILSGNGAKAVAPQINSIQKQGQQKLQTLSQFGNRSGGTNAEAATTADSVDSNINDLIASLTGTAATNLGGIGTNLLQFGSSSTEAGAKTILDNKSLFAQILNQFASGAGKAAGTAAFGGG